MAVLGRAARLVVLVLAGLVVAGVGALFVVVGLEASDRIASTLGFFVGVAGTSLSGYGVLLSRRSTAPPSRQSVSGSTVGVNVLQAQDVRGGLRMNLATTRKAADRPGASSAGRTATGGRPSRFPAGGQSVLDTDVGGSVVQINGVAGDVEIRR